jgi:polyhydroxybutyrate depolymerase
VGHIVLVHGLAGVYLPGGQLAQSSAPFDFTSRPYSVRLPASYDPSKPAPVIFEAGGCGSTAANFAKTPSSLFQIDPQHTSNAIEVGLSYVSGCFADGGPVIGDRTDSPEVPYFRAVLADVEARFCVDRGRIFVAGTSTGAWEADLLGCAAADVVRGTATMLGGLRAHRPACTGPTAAIFVASTVDTSYPLGPLDPSSPAFMRLDSPGLLPMRDDVLARNGCLGSASQQWDPRFPLCVTFTDCPKALPVVWCELTTGGIVQGAQGGIRYSPDAMWPFLSALPPTP